MKKKQFVLLVILACSAFLAVGANFLWQGKQKNETQLPSANSEYGKLLEHMLGDSIKKIEGIITLYDGTNPNKIKEQTTFSYIKNSSSYYSSFGYLKSYSDGEMSALVDTLHKVVFISSINNSAATSFERTVMPFSSSFNDTASLKSVATIEEINKERILTISSELTPEIKSMKLIYDSTYVIKRSEIEWWKNSSVTDNTTNNIWLAKIQYTKVASQADNVNNMMNNIFTIHNKTVVLTPLYRDYRVTTQF